MMSEVGKGPAKWVMDLLLDDRVKVRRLMGNDYRLAEYVSNSGSEHEGGELDSFVDGFFFSDNEDDAWGEVEDDGAGSAGSDGEDDRRSLPSAPVVAMVRDLLSPSKTFEHFERDLVAEVTKVVDRLAGLRANRSAFRRAVMSSLREVGYNAGICKARWETRGGLTAGSYEYIDVVRESTATPPSPQTQQQQRYVVDVEFAGEFVVARPTAEYALVSAELPRVYVGKPEELRRLLRLLADAARRSLRAREMHLPPWRKGRYMQAKWLGPYRRTLNPPPPGTASIAAPPPPPFFSPDHDMKCRFVGFDTAAAPRVIPPAGTKTR